MTDNPSPLTMERWITTSGWSHFTPAPDSRICYVSEEGDDTMGTFYSSASSEIGSDPFNPTGTIQTFATYEAARDQTRSDYADWILFKRGDVFTASIVPQSGKNKTYPALVSAYGSVGELPQIRPAYTTDSDTGARSYSSCISIFSRRGYNVICSVIANLDFYFPEKDPSNGTVSDYNSGGIGIMALGSGSELGVVKNILIEGCRFRYFGNNTIQAIDEGFLENVVIKRCQIMNNYSYSTDDGHSQGLYAYNINGLFFIENIFDHNGWLNQAADSGEPDPIGRGTMFNHNTYLTDCHNVEFTENISLRPSSIHHKFTANSGRASASHILMQNNLLIDGEVGISLGGNYEGEYRFKDLLVSENILTQIGRSRPTNRNLAWGIDVQDWDRGRVINNYMIHFSDPNNAGNNYGINIYGGIRDFYAGYNVVYDVNGNGLIISSDEYDDYKNNMAVTHNSIQMNNADSSWLKVVKAGTLKNVTIRNNHYFSPFNNTPFALEEENYLTFSEWQEKTRDNSTYGTPAHSDSERTVQRYNQEIAGGEATLDDFITHCRSQNRYNWNSDYTAGSVNSWLKAGFN